LRINYVIWYAGGTGGFRVLAEIMNRLVDRGHEVMVTTHDRSPIPFELKAKVNYIDMHPGRMSVRYRSRAANVLFNNRISRRLFQTKVNYAPWDQIESDVQNMPDCDINVAQCSFAAFSVYRSDKGIPFHHLQHFEEIFFLGDKYLEKVVDESCHLPINRIANSIWLVERMKERYGYDLPIVNPAIDTGVFYPRQQEDSSRRKKVLCYGREDDWKGFPEALQAMKLVMKQREDVEFLVYGRTPISYKDPEAPYTFLRNVTDDELARLYSNADVVLCPSWYESFPLPPLEAMACGAPVVTTRYGTEDYARHEENSLVVMPKDIKAMAQSIMRLLQDKDLGEQMGKKGIETAKSFTWETAADMIEDLFKKAISSGPST
jgi:glycosyltransferase involved in cell wall biosynthesis